MSSRALHYCQVVLTLAFGAGCDSRVRESHSPQGLGHTPGDVKMEQAMFGAGCFWGVEAAFREVEGVVDTAVGYSGGTLENPTYEDVCGRGTGHAEIVLVTFDPSGVAYEQLLDAFWACHNPTQVNRQGPDVGSQYRSAIFYFTPEQQAAARASKEKFEIAGKYGKSIATEITAAAAFWRAEEYHQRYVEKHGGSCPTN